MRNKKTFARNLTPARMVSLLGIFMCFGATSWSQAPQESPSAVAPLPADVPGSADRYSVMLMGNPAGQQAVWTEPDGSIHIFYQFNDRGRGPKTTSILQLDAKGLPIAETVTGNDYLKSAVHETYTLESGTARWKSALEEGDKKLSAPAVYVSVNGAPAELGILAQAALQNGGHVDLLPEGEAKIARLAQLDIETAGKKKHVTMYAITGLDFSPTYVWLDDRQTFFANVDFWSTVIPEGWEATAKTLQATQDRQPMPARPSLPPNSLTTRRAASSSPTPSFSMPSPRRSSKTKPWSSPATASALSVPPAQSRRQPGQRLSTPPTKRCCPGSGTCTLTSAQTMVC